MLDLFKKDAGRWVVPQEIADSSIITVSLILKLLWRHLPLQAMFLFRLGGWAHRKKIRGLSSFIQKIIAIVYGLELAVAQNLGGGLYIPHPFGTTIYVQEMGENCSIIGSVTIGTRNDSKFPILGNNVFVGVGARILGGIRIGDNAVIGANAVVIKDVPAGATAVGVPAKIVRVRDGITDSFSSEIAQDGEK